MWVGPHNPDVLSSEKGTQLLTRKLFFLPPFDPVCPSDKLRLFLGQTKEKSWVCAWDKLGMSLGQTRGRPKGNWTKKSMSMCLFLA